MGINKRILFYSDVYEPTHGGLVTSLKRILHGLCVSGLFEIHLLHYDPDIAKIGQPILQNGVYIHGHGNGEIDLAYLYTQSAQRKIIELEKTYDYSLFVAFFAHMPLLIVSNIANVFSKPYAICTRGSDIHVNMNDASYRNFLRPYFHDASALISVSAGIVDLVSNWDLLPKTKIVEVIPNSIDASLYLDVADRKLSGEPTHDFLFIGNARPEKRFDLVIEALNLLKDKGIRPKSCVVLLPHRRNPGLIEKYRQLADRYGLSDTIDFVSPMAFSNIKELYCKSKSFILASDHEGLSNTLLESMASGCFVLARHSLMPDAMKGSECICFFDQHSLADAMIAMLKNENNFSRVNREIVISKFDCDKEISSYERVFSDIIGRQP